MCGKVWKVGQGAEISDGAVHYFSPVRWDAVQGDIGYLSNNKIVQIVILG